MSKEKSSFLVQGSILALAGILVRVIGIIYRVPLNSILGDEGIGYYSIAFDVYSLFLLISSMSMPIAVSKIVSERVAKGRLKNAYRAFIGALVFGCVIGTIVFCIVFFGAEGFATLWGYPSAAFAIKTLAPTLFVMCFLGVLRGFFQGMGTMMPTAVSQILEQIVNAIVSIVAASILYDMGDKVGRAGAYSAAGGTIGTGAGALTALVFMVFVYFVYSPVYKKRIKKYNRGRDESYETLTKVLVITIMPVLLSTTVYNIGSIIDSNIYGNVMADFFKLSENEYSTMWGIYSGKYKLLTTAPIAVSSALATAVIPSLVRSYTTGNKSQIKHKVDSTLKLSMLVAIPSGMGLSILGMPIISLLFSNVQNVDVYNKIMIFSFFTVVFYSISTITNSVLQGIDKMRVPVINASISLVIHIPLLMLLLYVFKLDVYAVVIADFIFALIVCVLNNLALKKYINYKLDFVNVLLKPLAAAVVMAILTLASYKLFMSIINRNGISCILSIGIAVCVYFIMLLLLKGITEEELYMIPKGHILVNILKKAKLI